ncbi:CDP-archaeol synthase (plasmid) [Enterobacter sp. JS8-1]|uniref:CDP-archaeol synthase n=1 Tax=Enterobacter sp. JS8-1 TaxID=3411633 RepID=UPI003BA0C927
MWDKVLQAWYLMIPVILGGCAHMVIVKYNYFSRLNIPLSVSAFGANKTWRGLLMISLLTALFALIWLPLNQLHPQAGLPVSTKECGLAGLFAGLGYSLSELPNSLIKRKLGIAPGKLPDRHRAVCVLGDQADSAIGVTLVYVLYLKLSFISAVLIFICFLLSAFLIKQLLFLLALKKTRF